jgi:hypothetical protein
MRTPKIDSDYENFQPACQNLSNLMVLLLIYLVFCYDEPSHEMNKGTKKVLASVALSVPGLSDERSRSWEYDRMTTCTGNSGVAGSWTPPSYRIATAVAKSSRYLGATGNTGMYRGWGSVSVVIIMPGHHVLHSFSLSHSLAFSCNILPSRSVVTY